MHYSAIAQRIGILHRRRKPLSASEGLELLDLAAGVSLRELPGEIQDSVKLGSLFTRLRWLGVTPTMLRQMGAAFTSAGISEQDLRDYIDRDAWVGYTVIRHGVELDSEVAGVFLESDRMRTGALRLADRHAIRNRSLEREPQFRVWYRRVARSVVGIASYRADQIRFGANGKGGAQLRPVRQESRAFRRRRLRALEDSIDQRTVWLQRPCEICGQFPIDCDWQRHHSIASTVWDSRYVILKSDERAAFERPLNLCFDPDHTR